MLGLEVALGAPTTLIKARAQSDIQPLDLTFRQSRYLQTVAESCHQMFCTSTQEPITGIVACCAPAGNDHAIITIKEE